MSPAAVFISTAFLVVPVFIFLHKSLRRRDSRSTLLHPDDERVLILGGSSGIGRAIALKYVARGARVCVVGRAEPQVSVVVNECKSEHADSPLGDYSDVVLGVAADFADAEEMTRLRDVLEVKWNGLDTLVVAAGVSATLPLLSIAGIDISRDMQGDRRIFTPASISAQNVTHVADVAEKALHSNYIGPLVSAVTYIPLMSRTSEAPAIQLIASLGAVTPAPTRSIYGSTKAAALMLYQALSMEHPNIEFSYILPATVEGDFRASAVDRLSDDGLSSPTKGLKREYVAARCVRAVDRAEGSVFIPGYTRLAPILYWIFPRFIEGKAKRKYGFGD
ncbi:NAD(P)-binding protein [Fistulina hepatica ATCC 64428]|uniref:NAD(P)-binding protein n=1 Tax=Fistulina hepatica ATCC 64428 TaxID=1128425 RepID=A0A0D7AFX9_9AGAR|nr:NAD(P)-binding protein [Fistulina hepatica ATCC 64428]